MEKVRPWCGQRSDRGRLKNRTDIRTVAKSWPNTYVFPETTIHKCDRSIKVLVKPLINRGRIDIATFSSCDLELWSTYDLDLRTWPRFCQDEASVTGNFLQRLSHENTDIHTQLTNRIIWTTKVSTVIGKSVRLSIYDGAVWTGWSDITVTYRHDTISML